METRKFNSLTQMFDKEENNRKNMSIVLNDYLSTVDPERDFFFLKSLALAMESGSDLARVLDNIASKPKELTELRRKYVNGCHNKLTDILDSQVMNDPDTWVYTKDNLELLQTTLLT